jgi:flagellar biosynthesis/type III secretory pathway protein FliH
MTDYKQGYNDGYAEGMRDAGLERQTLHDMYYAEGYSDGHTDAWAEASLEMKRLRDCLHAILSRGEAPERVMSDE